MNVIETYEVGRILGKDNQINWVDFFVRYTLENTDFFVIAAYEIRLSASIPVTSTNEEIIQACLSNIGAETAESNRDHAYKQLTKIYDKSQNSIIKDPEIEAIPRLFCRLTLINNNLWETVENYFQSSDRTQEEKAFFEDAGMWRKNDPVLQSAITGLGLTNEQFNQLYNEAGEMFKADRESQIGR